MLTGSWVLDWFFALSIIQLLLPIVIWAKASPNSSKGIGEY